MSLTPEQSLEIKNQAQNKAHCLRQASKALSVSLAYIVECLNQNGPDAEMESLGLDIAEVYQKSKGIKR